MMTTGVQGRMRRINLLSVQFLRHQQPGSVLRKPAQLASVNKTSCFKRTRSLTSSEYSRKEVLGKFPHNWIP